MIIRVAMAVVAAGATVLIGAGSTPVAAVSVPVQTATPTPAPTPSPTPSPSPVPNSYIVSLPANTSPDETDRLAKELTGKHGGNARYVYTAGYQGFSVDATADEAAKIASDPAVESVTQDVYITLEALSVQPNPPSWGLDRIDERSLPLDQKYHFPNTAPNVVAYVIDTGILLTHQEFGGRAVCGWDPFLGGCAPCGLGHGTHVAGTIGGRTTGVAKGVRIVSVRVFNCTGTTTAAVIIAGVNFVTLAAGLNPGQRHVANMSLGGGLFAPLNAAVTASINANVHYSVAAGNNGGNACAISPASTAGATTVSVTDINDTRPVWGNFGACVDIFAPGVNITSAWHTAPNAYASLQGTSMSSPHAAV